MNKVIVTGGAGFIGSHLAEELNNRNYHVIILDNLSIGKIERIHELTRHGSSNIEFVEGNITELPLLQKWFHSVKYVFHQAALARVPFSIEYPISTNEANISGTLNVLLAARDNQVSKVIYASSSSVYGGAKTLPQKEDAPLNPLNPYALTKLAAEYYCEIFRQIYGLSTVSLRYFNVYGSKDPYSQYSTTVAAFLGRISQNLPLIIHGDGEQSRDMIYIADVVQANILAAEKDAEGIYNVGSGKNSTINELAGLMLKLSGHNLIPIYQEPRLGDPRQTLADISKARSFGYNPEYDLEAGLKQTINKEFNLCDTI